MIYIASGANVGNNYLEIVSLKQVEDISTNTKALLTLFDKTWSDTQKVAIDDFFVSFNAMSGRSKVKVLTMPILMKPANSITAAMFQTANSIYDKNLANLDVNVLPSGNLLGATYGFLGIGANGFVFQNATTGANAGTVYANMGVGYTVTSFGITNKSAHYGIYGIAPTKLGAGTAANNSPKLDLNTSASVNFYQSFLTGAVAKAAPHKGLYIGNASVTLGVGKSYMRDALYTTTLTGTATQTVQDTASVLYGGGSNVVNESTCSLLTFGEYMTDSELTEYAGIINTLMAVLTV